MHRHRSHVLRRLGHHRPLGWLAVVVLLLQVVLTADHLGATAARSSAPPGFDEALGILSLCHGDGSVDAIGDPADPSSHPPAAPCVLCTVAATAACGVVSAPPVVALPALVRLVVVPPAVPDTVPVRSPLRYGSLRGPPIRVPV